MSYDASMDAPLALNGLDEIEAMSRLAQFGPNILQEPRRRGILSIARSTLREPMFLFLLTAAALYLMLGDLGEGTFLIGGAILSIGLVVLQEARSERALAALAELAEPYARVIRGGQERKISARELVPGDLLLALEGERVPVDGVLIAGDVLTVDESILTGESVPVTKATQRSGIRAAADPVPGSENCEFLFAGTLVVRGQGIVEALRTGRATRLGRIGASLAAIAHEPTPLQKSTARLIPKIGLVSLAFCLIVFIAYATMRGNWIEGALAGITLAISLLPEEFPMVLAIFMAIGAWRLAQQKVLVRRAAAIETLGATTILCVDKTGTLTENRMKLAVIWCENVLYRVDGGKLPSPQASHLLGIAALASAVRPVDPMDRAIWETARATNNTAIAMQDGTPVQSHPLRPDLLAVIQAWRSGANSFTVAAKGAPEAISRLCGMQAEAEQAMMQSVAAMAAQGLRVLGVASRTGHGADIGELIQGKFSFHGLLGFLDPVRDDVPEALALARHAGVQVAMITGDYPATALEIARRAGIEAANGVLTGAEIRILDAAALREKVRTIRVFARVQPEQKLALVEALKANGEIVAMTGDGVNDAPALESAHIGVSMGMRGTDVAREASDIVLLDDSFASVVRGIAHGRRIFANLRKALTYVTAIHVPIAGLALLPIVFGLPPLLFPMHVVLLELVIDPVCALVFEAEPAARNTMERPPRPQTESLFGTRQLLLGGFQGLIILAATFGLYASASLAGLPEGEARGMAFIALVAAILVLAFANSAETGTAFFDRRRAIFWGIAGVTAAIVSAILYVPFLAAIFRIAPPAGEPMLVALVTALVSAGWIGIAKRLGAGRSD